MGMRGGADVEYYRFVRSCDPKKIKPILAPMRDVFFNLLKRTPDQVFSAGDLFNHFFLNERIVIYLEGINSLLVTLNRQKIMKNWNICYKEMNKAIIRGLEPYGGRWKVYKIHNPIIKFQSLKKILHNEEIENITVDKLFKNKGLLFSKNVLDHHLKKHGNSKTT